MNTENPLTLYIKEGCPYCRAAMEALDSKGIAYQTVEVRHDPSAMKQLEKISGQSRTPTAVFDDDVLANFDVADLDPFLQKHQLT